jgi:hypothetical protein
MYHVVEEAWNDKRRATFTYIDSRVVDKLEDYFDLAFSYLSLFKFYQNSLPAMQLQFVCFLIWVFAGLGFLIILWWTRVKVSFILTWFHIFLILHVTKTK